MTGEEFKEPLTFRTLLRYKFLILTVATVIVFGGYLRIVTQKPRYTAVARLRVRFSQELLNAPDVETRTVRTPVLEEEVKSYLVLLRDPNFIDQVLSELPPAPKPVDGAKAKEETTSAYGVLVNQALGVVRQVQDGLVSFLDTILFIKDTIVSARERHVLSTLARLEVEQGTDASHVITVSFTGNTAENASTMANAITNTFISLQKEKTRKRDIEALQRSVDEAKKYLEDVNRRRYRLAKALGFASIEDAIANQNMRLEELRLSEDAIRRGLALLELGIVPSHKDVPINVVSGDREAERAIMDRLMTVLMEKAVQVENFQLYEELELKLQKSRDRMKAERVNELKVELEAWLERTLSERERLAADTRVIELSPDYSSLTVDEKTAQANLLKAEEKLRDGRNFNSQLDKEHVAQNVALLAAAKPPPFPNQERRLLKLIVLIVLGISAGFGAATLRHIVWPKQGRRRTAAFPGPLGSELDVPIIVLPDESEDNLESDLEFDMTFPEEDSPHANRT